MSTDYQRARSALGARLRELRVESVGSGRELARRLGWPPSKISKLENGRQTPSIDDLRAWAEAVGNPAAAGELTSRLRGLETHYRSWRRQLAGGHGTRQEIGVSENRKSKVVRGFEVARMPGLFQTAEYARRMFILNAEFQQSPLDTEAAVRARMRRQHTLYEPGRSFRFIVSEGVLRMLLCPPDVMAAQLDRLMDLSRLDTVSIGIIPINAPMRRTPAHGFWIYDDRLVIVETINAEMWLDDADDIALYVKAWDWLNDSAVYGHQAHRLIAGALAGLPRN